ncbi:hypothetical protein BCR44DRAFT_326113 [Catenaria anguillulae PL171]|uniref:Uncharacterized protein n=1 Tax=Catenaria anguillulae PL171 TaxID=765915 RepID=A0A1Y2H3U3_9FUNG|nr:hypothetical protein BCR44DRAFT_326113 [Catenaria anguillulae PL171]
MLAPPDRRPPLVALRSGPVTVSADAAVNKSSIISPPRYVQMDNRPGANKAAAMHPNWEEEDVGGAIRWPNAILRRMGNNMLRVEQEHSLRAGCRGQWQTLRDQASDERLVAALLPGDYGPRELDRLFIIMGHRRRRIKAGDCARRPGTSWSQMEWSRQRSLAKKP